MRSDRMKKNQRKCRISEYTTLYVEHPLNKEMYYLIPAVQFDFDDHWVDQIVTVCNSPDILAMFNDTSDTPMKEFPEETAAGFCRYSYAGWVDKSHYVFLLVPAENEDELAGCFEISNEKNGSAELGFWIAPNHRGLGGAALSSILEEGINWHVKQFYAWVFTSNQASRRMLEKNNFHTVIVNDKLKTSMMTKDDVKVNEPLVYYEFTYGVTKTPYSTLYKRGEV